MADEQKTKLRLEIAHVLFVDIVGYSKLLIDEQSEALHELNQIVRNTDAAREAEAAEQLIILPTGDGMALVFTGSVEEPVECALQISQRLRARPSLPVRMGIHSGPVHHVADVNQRENIAGAGINLAQRVMDCGDAGHILVSKRVADDLAQYRRWQPYLHELGDFEVKHGVVVSIVNLYADVVGNPNPPERLKHEKQVAQRVAASAERAKRLPISVTLFVGFMLFTLAVLGIIFAPAILKQMQARQSTAPAPAASTTPSAASIPEKSVAVLPFQNLSENKENAYFADGVQDEILTDLAKVADLKVISRTSVLGYRDTQGRHLGKIGEELGVAHIVEGSVQRAGNRVRVNAQLIDARNDAHLWAQTYDRDLADVFAIQTEIAEAIAHQLQARLLPPEKAAMSRPLTTDLVANDLYQRALQLGSNSNDPGGKGNLLQSISLLEQAVGRDPRFLRAYCRMCETHLDLYWGGFDHTDARRQMARLALEHAESIAPDDGDVHMQKGIYFYHGLRDYDRARVELELARQRLPNSSKIYMQMGAIDRRQGRWDDCLRNFDRAVELDPRNFINVEEAAFTRYGLRRFAEAAPLLQRAIALDPLDPFAPAQLANLPFDQAGDLKKWRSGLNEIEKAGKAGHVAIFFVACALAERDHDAAERALALVPAEGAVNPYDNSLVPRSWFVALVASTFSEKEKAQAALMETRAAAQKAIQEQPDYAPAWSLLGKAEAGLGHEKEAIEAGRRGCELLPLSTDAWDGPSHILDLALIYTWLGQNNLALNELERASNTPALPISYGDVKFNPLWDPLRDDPRFEKIASSLAPR
jgi:TolB-like protein/class 3 adenylate cyclase/Tfp pilus assembly protein PilF